MRKSLAVAGSALTALHGATEAADGSNANNELMALATRDGSYVVTLHAPLNGNVKNMYAGHRSHSSHSSHASHSSGSGSSYRASPIYTAPPPPAPATPSSPASEGYTQPQPLVSPQASRPSVDQLRLMIMRVQAALYAKHYDPGAIDGELSEATLQALRKFQGAHGLPSDGKMTTQTLNALGVRLSQ